MTRIEQRLRAPARFASPPAGWTAGGYVLPDYGADDWIFDVMDEPEFWPAIDEAPAWTGACCLTTTNLATQAAQLNVDAGDDAGSATIALSGIRELVGTMLRGIVDGKAGPGITFGTFSGTRRRNADFEEARWGLPRHRRRDRRAADAGDHEADRRADGRRPVGLPDLLARACEG